MTIPLLLVLSILSIVLAPDPLQAQSFEAEEARVRLSVTTTPANARVMGEEDGVFRDLELLSGGFLLDFGRSRKGRWVYVVPEAWRGKSLRVQAAPATVGDRMRFDPSEPVVVMLAADSSGAPPVAALALREARAEGARPEDAAFMRAQRLYREALVVDFANTHEVA